MARKFLPGEKNSKNKKIAAVILVVLALVLVFWLLKPEDNGLKEGPASTKQSQWFNKSQYSLDEAASLWAIVNKGRMLPISYVPKDLRAPKIPLRLAATAPEMQLRSDAAAALERLAADASAQNIVFMLASGYRSYGSQIGVYGSYVKSEGRVNADRSSARPGYSEHQTGLAADLEPASRTCEVEQCFGDTTEGQWLAANAYKYGFIIRYLKDKESLTGYEYEPWHVRYVGKELAAQVQQSGLTLERFFDLPVYSSYPVEPYHLSSAN